MRDMAAHYLRMKDESVFDPTPWQYRIWQAPNAPPPGCMACPSSHM
jgi:hypothetical protein